MVRVVHQQLRLVPHLDDLDATVTALTHAFRALLVEADRLAMLEVDPVRLVLAHEVERAVVVDVAVLEDLHERAALVRSGGAQHLRQMPTVGVDRARDERRLRADRDRQRIEGQSSEPIGVDFVRFPSGDVGEYCPFVSP